MLTNNLVKPNFPPKITYIRWVFDNWFFWGRGGGVRGAAPWPAVNFDQLKFLEPPLPINQTWHLAVFFVTFFFNGYTLFYDTRTIMPILIKGREFFFFLFTDGEILNIIENYLLKEKIIQAYCHAVSCTQIGLLSFFFCFWETNRFTKLNPRHQSIKLQYFPSF